MHIVLLTLFPEYFTSPLSVGLLGKAFEKGILQHTVINIRDYAINTYGQVDDTPYGGGAGLIMRPEPLAAAITAAKSLVSGPVIYFTPAGPELEQSTVEQLGTLESCILLCGRYEGIDQRIIDHYVDHEISLGRYIIQGGEVAALTFIEAITRFVPGVIGNTDSVTHDSFSPALAGKKEYPLYTKPASFQGMEVPPVLLSGNHDAIAQWKEEHLR